MYLPKYFKLTELVSRKIYEKRGDMAFGLFDDRLLQTLDQLREQFGSLTCNNWAAGGDRQYSGFRASSEPYYSPFSQHSFGRAVDLISKKHTASAMREYIFNHPNQFPYITFVEEGGDVSWLHVDCRNLYGFIEPNQDGICFWNKNSRVTRFAWRHE